jgi:hypothetical protein
LSGVYVFLIRLLGTSFNSNESAGRIEWGNELIASVEKEINHRAGGVAVSEKVHDLVRSMLRVRKDEWKTRASNSADGSVLTYRSRADRSVPLLRQPTEDSNYPFSV